MLHDRELCKALNSPQQNAARLAVQGVASVVVIVVLSIELRGIFVPLISLDLISDAISQSNY